jgi:hypothetical protein
MQTNCPPGVGASRGRPNDELRGIALRADWLQKLITGDELLESLIKPQRQSYSGAYRHFLSVELSENWAPADLPVALNWCSKHPEPDVVDEFEDAVSECDVGFDLFGQVRSQGSVLSNRECRVFPELAYRTEGF